MNVLISACIKVADAEPLLSFPVGLLSESDLAMLTWTKKYYTSYGQLPTADRIHQQFPGFIDFSTVTDPLGDIVAQTIERKKAELSRRALLEMTEADANDDDVSPIILKYSKLLVSSGGDVALFSTFDRMDYLAPRHPLLFGMPFLDKMTKGIGAGELCYLVGRLGVGKSSIAQWLAVLWWHQNLRVFYASNESLFVDVFARMDAMVGGFNPLSLRDVESANALIPRLKSIAHVASQSKGDIMIPKKRVLDVDDLFAQAVERDSDALVIDGVYLMHVARAKGGSSPMWERITDVSRQVKQNALATGLRVVGLHQTKRGTGTGERKMDNEDAAYSDALAQDADFMLGIQRMEPIANEHEKLAVELMKNRYGPRVGTVVSIDFDTMTLKEQVEFVERERPK